METATPYSSKTDGINERLRRLEDQIEIYQILATYGPSVDCLAKAPIAEMWTEDAFYDSGRSVYHGRDAISDIVDRHSLTEYVAQGCAHVISMPYVVIHGDTATATAHSRIYLYTGDHWRVEVASANCWEFVRMPEGWRVKKRTNRPLVGSQEPRDVLRKGIGS